MDFIKFFLYQTLFKAFKFVLYRGQLSTYKELCSLATDLNQPELIYKFMNLANHNAIWNSKKVNNVFKLIYSHFLKYLFVIELKGY